MSDENVHHQDEDDKSTQNDGTQSDDGASEFDKLFADDEEDDGKDEVEVLKSKIDRMQKGMSKFFSEQGRKKKEASAPASKKEEPKSDSGQAENPVLKSLYLNANPDAREVWDEVVVEAKKLGKDPFTLYEESSYFRGEAKTRAEAKKSAEESKGKVASPSSIVDQSGTISFGKIDLTNPDHTKWLNAKSGRREEYMKWYATH